MRTQAKKGDTIRIIEMKGEPRFSGKIGTVEHVDSIGQIHGTWGGCAIQPEHDRYDLRDALIESNDKIEELKSINKKELDALRKENAYLRRLALHALSGWAIGMSMANAYLSKGSRGKQIKYYMVFEKFENLHNIEKNKWRKEKAESYK